MDNLFLKDFLCTCTKFEASVAKLSHRVPQVVAVAVLVAGSQWREHSLSVLVVPSSSRHISLLYEAEFIQF